MQDKIKDSPIDYIDPAWDYATIFKMLLELNYEVGAAMAYITNQEVATAQTNNNLNLRLQSLAVSLLSVQEKLK